MSDRELSELLTRRQRRDGGDGRAATDQDQTQAGADRCDTACNEVHDLPRALMHIAQHRQAGVTYLVKLRDVHDHGVVFLHGGFVYEGARCALLLRRCDGAPGQIPATVLRCRHLAGRVHEVVAVFDRPTPVGDYWISDQSCGGICPQEGQIRESAQY